MKLLLDTHIWVWSLLDPRRVGRKTARILTRPGAELWLSSVSVWELIDLCQKGRFRPMRDPIPWVEAALQHHPLRAAPLTHEITLEAGRFQMPHNDPADSLIVATARVLGLTLVTADYKIIEAGVVPVLAND